MKAFLLSTMLLVVMVSGSCKKNDSLADLVVGNWQQVSAYSGTNATYQPVTVNTNVRFNNDGTLSGNAYPNYTSYKVTQSAMTFTNASGASVTFGYSFNDNLLQLNQVGCTGGCGVRFQKIP